MFRVEFKELYKKWQPVGVFSTEEIADYHADVFQRGHGACDVRVVEASDLEIKNFDFGAEAETLKRLSKHADVVLHQAEPVKGGNKNA